MTDTETEKKGFSMLYRIGALIGLLAGLLMNFETVLDASPAQQRESAVTGFYIALASLLAVGILERLLMAALKALQKGKGGSAKPPLATAMKLLLFFGLATFSIGVGIFISSLWRGEQYIRVSLEVVAPSAGLLLGLQIRRLLFVRDDS
jgi:hypothetical protein